MLSNVVAAVIAVCLVWRLWLLRYAVRDRGSVLAVAAFASTLIVVAPQQIAPNAFDAHRALYFVALLGFGAVAATCFVGMLGTVAGRRTHSWIDYALLTATYAVAVALVAGSDTPWFDVGTIPDRRIGLAALAIWAYYLHISLKLAQVARGNRRSATATTARLSYAVTECGAILVIVDSLLGAVRAMVAIAFDGPASAPQSHSLTLIGVALYAVGSNYVNIAQPLHHARQAVVGKKTAPMREFMRRAMPDIGRPSTSLAEAMVRQQVETEDFFRRLSPHLSAPAFSDLHRLAGELPSALAHARTGPSGQLSVPLGGPLSGGATVELQALVTRRVESVVIVGEPRESALIAEILRAEAPKILVSLLLEVPMDLLASSTIRRGLIVAAGGPSCPLLRAFVAYGRDQVLPRAQCICPTQQNQRSLSLDLQQSQGFDHPRPLPPRLSYRNVVLIGKAVDAVCGRGFDTFSSATADDARSLAHAMVAHPTTVEALAEYEFAARARRDAPFSAGIWRG